MLSIDRSSTYANVLLVYGDELGSDLSNSRDPRGTLIGYLEGSSVDGSPVGSGSHDCWVVYQVGTDAGPNHSWQDMSLNPRPRRGVVQMGLPPSDPPGADESGTTANHLSTLCQEYGHCWCVPANLGIRMPDVWPAPHGPYLLPGSAEVASAHFDGTPFTGPLLLGRSDLHWSTFFEAQASPFDGMHWSEQADEGGVVEWTTAPVPSYTLSVAGLPDLSAANLYCDLDLLIMGVKSAAEAYAADGNRFYWLEPLLAAPIDYHAGLVVGFGSNDFFYFGFYRDHRQVAVQQIGGPVITRSLDGYRPFATTDNNIALRIVRRRDTYTFQLKLDTPNGTTLTPRLLDHLQRLPPADPTGDLRRWRTLGSLNHAGTPLAIGVAVKTWSPISWGGYLASAEFLNVEVKDTTHEYSLITSSQPEPAPGRPGDYARLPSERLVFEIAKPGPRVRGSGLYLRISAPYASYDLAGNWQNYGGGVNHWTAVNEAPKALTKAPTGDFAVATSARMHRSGYSPWAAGFASGTTIWGRRRTATALSVVLPDDVRDRQRVPPDNAYKTAFIIVAGSRSAITEDNIRRVDTIRRYWDEMFRIATESRRRIDSSL